MPIPSPSIVPIATTLLCCAGAVVLITQVIPRYRKVENRDGGQDAPRDPVVIGRWIPYLGAGLFFAGDPDGFIRKYRKMYGNIFTLYLNRRNMIFVTDPRIFPTILKDSKTFSFDVVREDISQRVLLQPHTLVTSPKIQQTIHSLYIKHLTGSGVHPITHSFISHLLTTLTPQLPLITTSPTVNLQTFTRTIMFPSSTNALYGTTAPTHIAEDIFTFDDGFLYLFAGLPSFFTAKYTAALQRCIAAMETMLAQGMQDANPLAIGQDQACIEEGMDLRTRATLAVGLLWGLQTNALQAAFWCLAYLVTKADEEFRDRLREEGKECLKVSVDPQGNIAAENIDVQKLSSAPLLSSLFNETLRYASGTLVLREVAQDSMLMDVESGKVYRVQEGDLVALPVRHVHLDEGVHERAEEFLVERFVKERGGRYELMPFGGGVSLCPGRFFAANEIKAFVVVLLQVFDICTVDPLPDVKLARYGEGVMPPAEPMRVRLKLKEEWVAVMADSV
ncbi:hypothetical protein HDV00_007201 [Rhizophlyctis rosea]|nr:hypothetical protein HDV00_007201 [Rhizophlyctis rosea]